MPQVPVTILNGFLGAGKTTSMQSLLVQARRLPDIRLGVIVNEMSELDVDGAILDTSEVIARRDPHFAAIPAGSISAERGLQHFTRAVRKVVAEGGATHVLIETSGSTHPWPLLDAIRNNPALGLHGFLSVVDTLTLAQDHDLGRTILPAASRNLAAGSGGSRTFWPSRSCSPAASCSARWTRSRPIPCRPWRRPSIRSIPSPEFGDRYCRLTVIGDRHGLEEFATAVRGCFCTPDEIAAWKAGERFDDPWPATIASLSQG